MFRRFFIAAGLLFVYPFSVAAAPMNRCANGQLAAIERNIIPRSASLSKRVALQLRALRLCRRLDLVGEDLVKELLPIAQGQLRGELLLVITNRQMRSM